MTRAREPAGGVTTGTDIETVMRMSRVYDPPLDSGIAPYVRALQSGAVETSESCEGGDGHAFPVPTIRFFGGQAEGFRALGVALQNGLPVANLRRVWSVIDGEPTGPEWELTFVHPAPGELAASPAD